MKLKETAPVKHALLYTLLTICFSSATLAADCGDASGTPCARPHHHKQASTGTGATPPAPVPIAKPAPTPTDSSLSPTPVIDRSGKASYCQRDETSHTDTDGHVYCINHGDHGKHHGNGGGNSRPIILPTAGRIIYPPNTPYVDGYGTITYCPGLLIIDTTGTGPYIRCDVPQPVAETARVLQPVAPKPVPALPTSLKSDRNLRSDRNP